MSTLTEKLISRFLDEIIWKEPWFMTLHDERAWDLIILAGSHVRGDARRDSDIDIFLITSKIVQEKHALQPVHEYKFENIKFDVSKVTTEKLERSINDKRNLFWWHKTHILRSNNPQAEQFLTQAATVTENDLRNLLWNNFCLFEIERTSNLPNVLAHTDLLGAGVCFSKCIEYVMESVLINLHIFVSSKKQGFYIKKLRPNIYQILSSTQKNYTPQNSTILLEKLREVLICNLIERGFTLEEMHSWDKHHLSKFLHQSL